MKVKKSNPSIQPSLFGDEELEPVSPTEPQISVDYDFTDLFERLSKSDFRSRFQLKQVDRDYIARKGLDVVRQHAADFVAKRLAPAILPNDGKQTPMRGHPVFIAQHATGCCCRGCFQKWHHIQPGIQLSAEQQHYAVAVIMAWIERQLTL